MKQTRTLIVVGLICHKLEETDEPKCCAPKLNPQKRYWVEIGATARSVDTNRQRGSMIKSNTNTLRKVPFDGPTFQSMLKSK